MKFILFLIINISLWCSCQEADTVEDTKSTDQPASSNENASKLPLNSLLMPEGFSMTIYADDVENARQMYYDESTGYLFVGSRKAGNVYALKDTDEDGKIDQKTILASGLDMPVGVAMKDGDLYVADISKILKFTQVADNIQPEMPYKIIYDQFPKETHHGWKYIDFGPDGTLYVPVGAPCNICDTTDIFATITRLDLDSKEVEIVQHGIRNTVGFTWHPETKNLWFTDNGRDWMGDDMPDCELNVATKENMHFGYPYCHADDILDPDFGKGKDCNDYEKPVVKLGPHVAPLGLHFYTGNQFPDTFQNQLFIAEHGSWNRSKKIGYRIKLVNTEDPSQQVFIKGWLNEETQEVWGRPVDIEPMPDGSLLISDDYANVIYRLEYKS